MLDQLHRFSVPRVRGWNEEELKMELVSRVFLPAGLEEEGSAATFFERPMSATLNDVKLSVICDCLLAALHGLTLPKSPYFFLQEYKKRKGESDDPEGQMLAAMLIAQHENPDDKLVYGCWVQGNFWAFTVLQGKDCFSAKRSIPPIEKNLRTLFSSCNA